LVDGHFLDGKKHGVAVLIERIYERFAELNPDVLLIIGLERESSPDCAFFAKANVEIVYYTVGGFLRFFIDLPFLMFRRRPDLVHTQYFLPLRFGNKASRHVSIHDILFEDFPEFYSLPYRVIRSFLFRISARRADLLTTISHYSSSRIQHYYRPQYDLHIIPLGMMDEVASSDALSPHLVAKPFFLYVSRFERRKNHLRLIEAFSRIGSDNSAFSLVLVGFDVDGSLEDTKIAVSKAGLTDKIIFLSNISDSELNRLYVDAAAVIYPSLCEGYGMPVVESLALNEKTFFSNTTAMAEFEFARDNMFDPYSVDAISGVMKAAISSGGYVVTGNSTDKSRFASFIRERFTWELSAQSVSALSQEFLSEAP
jgi:glycosyltransferase involved in cell wall biosynthesis